MSKHTPTPWVVSGDLRHVFRDQPGGTIAVSAPGRWLGLAVVYASPGRASEAAANAEFIARACNAHDGLLTACERALSFARDSVAGVVGGVNEIHRLNVIDTITAAIAKATAQEPHP
jgi:hypothetical protein